MRFIIALITSLILLIPASGQGGWEKVEVEIDLVPSPTGKVPVNLIYVQFIDRDIGFIAAGAVGYHVSVGTLLKTEDGGRTWNLIYDIGNCPRSLNFVDESKGFMISPGGDLSSSLLSTFDGGYSWIRDNTIPEVSRFFFVSDSIGWTVGDYGVYKTINGGDSFNKEYHSTNLNENINSLFFFDEESGWLVGNGGWMIKHNSNDGWVNLPRVTSLPLNKVFFVDRDHGWIAGGYSNDNNYFNPIFLRTVDSGENWDNITKPNYLINDFYFENKGHGWAVGEYGSAGVILETFNGGMDWDVVKDSLPARLNVLKFYDGIGWAVGDSGLILTNDSNITGIKDDHEINNGNESLFQNYPNPFQATTIISFQLPATSDVELSVYDISGRKVTTLVNKRELADRYQVEWNAEGMNPGIYFCELKTGQGKQIMKMILVSQ